MSSAFAFSDPWREELTPRTRASRRRWAVVETVLLLAMGATALSGGLRDALAGDGDGRGLVLLVALLVVFGVLQRGTRSLGSLRSGDGDLDERDLASRHRAFRTAFGLFLVVLLATLACLPAALPDGTTGAGDARQVGGSYLDGGDLTTLGIWLFSWAVLLPTVALAWREPDAPPLEDEDVRPVLGEGVRDLLLVAALLLGAGIAVASPTGDATIQSLVLPYVPFAVLVCVIGAIRGRRAGDRPLRAAFRGWRIVTALLVVSTLGVLLGLGTTTSTDAGALGPGAHEVTFLRSTNDGPERRVRCLEIVARDGETLSGPSARREARRLGEDAGRVCD